MIIRERLREALQRKNMRQADLVAHTGIDKSQISSYLSGKYKPKQENLTLLAEALDVSEYWLLGVDEAAERGTEKADSSAIAQGQCSVIFQKHRTLGCSFRSNGQMGLRACYKCSVLS